MRASGTIVNSSSAMLLVSSLSFPFTGKSKPGINRNLFSFLLSVPDLTLRDYETETQIACKYGAKQ